MATGTGSKTGNRKRNTSSRGKNVKATNRGNSRNTKAKKRNQEPMDGAILYDIILIAVFAVAIILFLCNFGLIGAAGNAISGIMFGLFGVLAYVAPILLFVAIAFGTVNQGNTIARRKLIAGVVVFVLLGVIFELLTGRLHENDTYNAVAFFENGKMYRNGGGLLFGSVAFFLHHFLSTVGTVLVVLVAGIICGVIITDKSFVDSVVNGGHKVMEMSRDDADRRKERAKVRQEEMLRRKEELTQQRKLKEEEKENEKILRMDKKVSGVMLDTALKEQTEPPSRDDMHEIVLDDMDNMPVVHQYVQQTIYEPEEVENRQDEYIEPYMEPYYEPEPIPVHNEIEKPKAVMKPSAAPIHAEAPSETMEQLTEKQTKPPKKYVFPPLSRLQKGKAGNGDSMSSLRETASRLQQTLQTFGVRVAITDISQGPSVTRYELQPEQGVKVSKIVGLADDIKLNLAATDIRIEAPIPGKAAVGIEVPNKENSMVVLRDLLESKEFKEFPSNLAFAVGKDIGGKVIVTDIAKMPHMLIAGSTGSGKSVCINTLIMSILYKAHPDDVKLIMVDPKVVELSVYNGIPHLMIPVVTEPKKAAAALQWGVSEMTERYQKFADFNVRDLKGYNQKVESMRQAGDESAPAKMPQIVIIVDELADLMMVAAGEVEEAICRLAQLARAAGIHLIIATQRPSVDVITGLIKANMPSRVAFAVSSGVDSRTILDMNGAEKLLGKGDMLFYPQGYPKPARIQGAFVSDKEVSDVVDFLKNQALGNTYNEDIEERIQNMGSASALSGGGGSLSERDQYFEEAGKFVIEKDKASIGMLQRVFKIGFNRAARIMDQLCDAGVVGEEEGTKPRKVLMSMEQFEQYLEEY